MYKYLVLFVLIIYGNTTFSQNYYPYQDIKLEKPSDFTETKTLALSASDFLLSTPFEQTDINRANAMQFLSAWMAGTKDYSFYWQGIVMDIAADSNLLNLYLAALVKFTLENKNTALSPLMIERNTCKLLIAYCDDPKNNFKLKKRYRKLLEKS